MQAATPRIAFIGAGRLARTLAQAFTAAGIAVVAVGSRSPSSAQALATGIPGCKACAMQEAVEAADLVFISVPDDAIGAVASAMTWRAGQGVVHCSGATEVAVLAAAAKQGALIGGFHPLQLFADPATALSNLRGSSVAIEAPEPLDTQLQHLAAAIGYAVIKLPPGVRGLYHASTGYAASFMLSLLREACDVWAGFGIDEQATLAALLPLARGTLDAARNLGLAGALAGPISRGDVTVLQRHMSDLAMLGADAMEFYRTLAAQQLRLARERGKLTPETLDAMAQAIGIALTAK